MLILSSKLDRLNLEYIELRTHYDILADKWNSLVNRINDKGGEDFLDQDFKLSADDIKRLLSLCHPDKHDGKQLAVDMTQKLLKMRDK